MKKMVILETTPTTINFTITPSTNSFLNAIRRTLLSEVPTIAIDLVTVHKNTTCIPNEMLVHRLSLIPLPITPLKRKEECTCNVSCPECSVTFSLNAVSNEGMTVNASHLFSDAVDTTRLKGLICKMGEKQSVKMTALARTGVAKEHAKFCVVTVVKINGEKIEFEVLDEVGKPADVLVMALRVIKEKVGRLIRAIEEYEG